MRLNPEYTDNLMKIDEFIFDGLIFQSLIDKEKKILRQFYKKRLVLWIQDYTKKLQELQIVQPETITCRICDKTLDVQIIDEHTENCLKMAELRKQIIDLDVVLKQISEETQKIQQKYNTQKNLQRNKRKVTGQFRMKKLQQDTSMEQSNDSYSKSNFPQPNNNFQSQNQKQLFKRCSSLNTDQLFNFKNKIQSEESMNNSIEFPSLSNLNNNLSQNSLKDIGIHSFQQGKSSMSIQEPQKEKNISVLSKKSSRQVDKIFQQNSERSEYNRSAYNQQESSSDSLNNINSCNNLESRLDQNKFETRNRNNSSIPYCNSNQLSSNFKILNDLTNSNENKQENNNDENNTINLAIQMKNIQNQFDLQQTNISQKNQYESDNQRNMRNESQLQQVTEESAQNSKFYTSQGIYYPNNTNKINYSPQNDKIDNQEGSFINIQQLSSDQISKEGSNIITQTIQNEVIHSSQDIQNHIKLINRQDFSNIESPRQSQQIQDQYKISPHQIVQEYQSDNQKNSNKQIINPKIQVQSNRFQDEYDGLSRIEEVPKEDSKYNTFMDIESSKNESKQNSLTYYSQNKFYYSQQNSVNILNQDSFIQGESHSNLVGLNNNLVGNVSDVDRINLSGQDSFANINLINNQNNLTHTSNSNQSTQKKIRDGETLSPKSLKNEQINNYKEELTESLSQEVQKRNQSIQQQENVKISNELDTISEDPFEKSPYYRPKRISEQNREKQKLSKHSSQKSDYSSLDLIQEAQKESPLLGEADFIKPRSSRSSTKSKNDYENYDHVNEIITQDNNIIEINKQKQVLKIDNNLRIQRNISDLVEGFHETNSENNLDPFMYNIAITPSNKQPLSNKSASTQININQFDFIGLRNLTINSLNFISPTNQLQIIDEETKQMKHHHPQSLLIQDMSNSPNEDQIFGLQLKIQESMQDLSLGKQNSNEFFKSQLIQKSPLNTSQIFGKVNGISPLNVLYLSEDITTPPKDTGPRFFIFNQNKLTITTPKQIKPTLQLNTNILSTSPQNRENSTNNNILNSNISGSGGQDIVASPIIFRNFQNNIIEDSDILINSRELAQINEKKYLTQQQVLLNLYKQQQQFDFPNMKQQIQNFDYNAIQQIKPQDTIVGDDTLNMRLEENQDENIQSDFLYSKHDNMRGDIFLDEIKKQKLEEKLNMLYSQQVQEEDNEEGSCIFPQKYMVSNPKNIQNPSQGNNDPNSKKKNSLGYIEQLQSKSTQNIQFNQNLVIEQKPNIQQNTNKNTNSPSQLKNNIERSNINSNQILLDSCSSSSRQSSSTLSMQASFSQSSSVLQSDNHSPTYDQQQLILNNQKSQNQGLVTPQNPHKKNKRGKKKKNRKNSCLPENYVFDQLSSTSKESYDVLQRISEEENNVLKSLEALIPIHNRLLNLENQIKSVQSSFQASHRNSIEAFNRLGSRANSNSNEIALKNNSQLIIPNLNDNIPSQTDDEYNYQKRNSFMSAKGDIRNSPSSSGQNQQKFPQSSTTTPIHKTSKFGMIKRAQTMFPNQNENVSTTDTNQPKEDSESQQGSKFNIFGLTGVSSKLLKSINSAFTYIIQYGEKISKRADLFEINYDIKTQTNLKYSLPEIISESEAVQIVKKMIDQLNERIILQRKVFKLKENDSKLFSQIGKETRKRRSSLVNEINYQCKENDQTTEQDQILEQPYQENSQIAPKINMNETKFENQNIKRVQKQYEYNSLNMIQNSPQSSKGYSTNSNKQTKKVNFANNKDIYYQTSDISTQLTSENAFENNENYSSSIFTKDSANKKSNFNQNFENNNYKEEKSGSNTLDASQDSYSSEIPNITQQINEKPKQSRFVTTMTVNTNIQKEDSSNDDELQRSEDNIRIQISNITSENKESKIKQEIDENKVYSLKQNHLKHLKYQKDEVQTPGSTMSRNSDGNNNNNKHSYKNPRNISNFLKSPCKYPAMPLLQDINSQKPLINRALAKKMMKQKNEKKFKQEKDKVRSFSSDSHSDEDKRNNLKVINGCNSEQVSTVDLDKKRKKSKQYKQIDQINQNQNEENLALHFLSNSTQITGLSYEKSPQMDLQLITKQSKYKNIYKADEILKEAIQKYNQRQLENEIEKEQDFDSYVNSSDDDFDTPLKYYSDSDVKYFNGDDITFTQQNIMNLGLKDFDFKRVLGVGAFGAVWLVNKKTTKDEYALKIIDCSQQVKLIYYYILHHPDIIISIYLYQKIKLKQKYLQYSQTFTNILKCL